MMLMRYIHHFVFQFKSSIKSRKWSFAFAFILLIFFSTFTCIEFLKQDMAQFNHAPQSPQDDDTSLLHPLTQLLLKNPDKQALYVEFGKNAGIHGLGSLVMLLILWNSYFGRGILAVNEADIPIYRFNETTGPFNGFFQTSFPVLESHKELELVQSELFNYTNGNVTWDVEPVKSEKIIHNISMTKRIAHLDYTDNSDAFKLVGLISKEVWLKLPQAGPSFCDLNFQFQPHIETAIQEHFQQTLPDLDFNDTVAFHVRRGDKIGDEDILHNASEYVQSFLTEVQSATTIRHCFLASDDPKVKTEMQLALKEHNVNCKLFTLLNDNMKGVASSLHSRTDTSRTMDFMYELYAMIQSKYFFGSNKSNVWKMATLFRGCRSENDAVGAILENQFHSYEITGAKLTLFHSPVH